MDVSIIIVGWNTRDVLRECLRSIYAAAGNVEFEAIVADNASTDGSVRMLKEEFPRVVLIENTENKGFAAANNQGLAVAKGRYVLLLNPDTVILDDALGRVVSFADRNPQAAVVGCRVLNPDRTLQQTCFMFPSLLNMLLSSSYLYKLFPQNRFFGRERMTWWQRDDERPVDVVTGCFMLVRRSAIEKVGNLDERFFVYGEETDWCYRFKLAGLKMMFTPEAEIVHIGGASSRQARPEMVLQLRGSILLFFRKHRTWPAYFAACGLVALFFLLRLPYWIICAVCKPTERKYCLQTARTYMRGVIAAISGGQGLLVAR